MVKLAKERQRIVESVSRYARESSFGRQVMDAYGNRCAVTRAQLNLVDAAYSAHKALVVGWQQHALVPGPNSGWSEATAAGALQRRLVGPIWQNGMQVADLWLGDANDPKGGRPEDMRRMCVFVVATCLLSVGWL